MSKARDSFEEFQMQVLQDMEELAEKEEKFYRDYAHGIDAEYINQEDNDLYYVDCYQPNM